MNVRHPQSREDSLSAPPRPHGVVVLEKRTFYLTFFKKEKMATYILTPGALIPYPGQEHNDPKAGPCHATMALNHRPEETMG